METCRICHFEVPLDDAAVQSASGKPICLRCYQRLSDSERPMPRRLRQWIDDCLAELAVHEASR